MARLGGLKTVRRTLGWRGEVWMIVENDQLDGFRYPSWKERS